MTLETLGNVGEFVGGIAVIASLLYLAFQIRQNTISLRETISRQIHDANARVTLLPVEHPEVSEIVLRGSQDLNSLDPAESFRLHLYLMAGFLHYQDTYSHASRSLIERHLWVAHESHMFEFLASPGLSAWSSQNRHRFSPEFVDFVEAHRSSEE
jgi:hypothetical protein